MPLADQATEEARAALWRDQQRRRAQYQAGLWQSLAGDPAVYQRFQASWQPLLDWLAEQGEWIDPQDEIDPMGISDTVNVGE